MNVTKRKQSMLKEVTASSLTHIFMLNMALFGKKNNFVLFKAS